MIENILWFLLFGVLFFFMMRKGGCGMHAHGGHQHGGDHAGHDAGANHTPGAEIRDPVCGMTLTAESASGTTQHQGRTFFFCSAKCQRTFLGEPQRYAG